MDEHEIEALLQIAGDESQPIHARRGCMEQLQRLNGDLDLGNRHRLEKVETSFRRQFDLLLRGSGREPCGA